MAQAYILEREAGDSGVWFLLGTYHGSENASLAFTNHRKSHPHAKLRVRVIQQKGSSTDAPEL